jgi:hypothetical protein
MFIRFNCVGLYWSSQNLSFQNQFIYYYYYYYYYY